MKRGKNSGDEEREEKEVKGRGWRVKALAMA